MPERGKASLKASIKGIKRANKARLIFLSKIDFAASLEISRATVQKFFTGKPVERETFQKICQRLKLPWKEIAALPEENESSAQFSERDKGNCFDVVQDVRQKGHASIQQRCGMMRVLDMSQPVKLNDIYINVNILEKISAHQRLEVADLLKVCSNEFQRPGLGKIVQDRVPSLEAVERYSKLIIVSKPGAGKTTLLKYLAIQCSFGEFQANLIPIFITLKDFAETEQQPSLLEYITEQLSKEGIADTAVTEQLLSQGKMLILLDGLDEVKEIDSQRVLQSVRSFYTNFPKNRFVITCRIAARKYTFDEFTEVELTDFDDEQIAAFAKKWFAAKAPLKAEQFVQKLKKNSPIQEIAICPLLLTMLCLVFEESADFPSSRSELYKEGLDILLKKWDAKRNIERDQVYKKLSIKHKEDILSQIALITFERGDYFFKHKEIQQHIVDYIRNLPDASANDEALQLESEAVVKSIEAQHGLLVERARGIYSFSHLTFHEYLTARKIVASSDPQALKTALLQLVSRITEKRWREVFLLTTGMLRNAGYLLQLMKQQIDDLIAKDKHLQVFFTWVSQKSRAVTAGYKPVVVRAFYLDRVLDLDLVFVSGNQAFDLALALASSNLTLALALDRNLALDRTLDYDLALDRALNRALDLARAVALDLTVALDLGLIVALDGALELALTLDLDRVFDPELELALQQLKAQIPDSEQDREKFKVWWIAFGGAWTETLRALMISKRNIGHDWRFSEQQKQTLRQYYDANQLLVNCLNSHCYVTRAVGDEILETLLLPSLIVT